jgi:Tfp pilus assembly protein PilN
LRQQVNLFRAAFRRDPKLLSAIHIAQGGAALLVCLLAWGGMGARQLARDREEVKALQAQVAEVAGMVEKLRAVHPTLEKSPHLEEEVRRLSADLARRQILAVTLKNNGIGSREGLSRYFEALARQHMEGIWLLTIAIQAAGREIEITGRTHRPERVPEYAERLGREDAFAHKSFTVMEISRLPEKEQKAQVPLYEFTLATFTRPKVGGGRSPGSAPGPG